METGIDQLNLHSVQLGYLKILQVGNTDPNNTKVGKQIRGQASTSKHHSLRSEPCSSSTSLPKLETTRNDHPETQTSRRTNELLCTSTQQLRTSFPTLIQGFKWVAIERATLKESNATKIAQIIGGERRQSTENKSR
ncbi:pentatricopeptide repeat-containing protein mitochondrial [Dorcoceras hygrometricum]|uniref:Pentatricopeptide repeat-containing protein mitochondrial n=1 Tax=Dorcoceras hygrometricum TaxID=472368 RepID=A0A2Z7DDQ0_9LAMI|nr:pentatricopeptide repeat-containing protein mitochondrial [Dorcoceras hygrometricum]